jgi:hypothetical protein
MDGWGEEEKAKMQAQAQPNKTGRAERVVKEEKDGQASRKEARTSCYGRRRNGIRAGM